MFKGLTQIGELLKDPGAYDAGQLAVIAGIKILALLVAASALFRGGRIFPATFIGVALGMLGHVLIPGMPLGLAVACGIVGVIAGRRAATAGSRSSSASPSPTTSRCCRCSASSSCRRGCWSRARPSSGSSRPRRPEPEPAPAPRPPPAPSSPDPSGR